MYANQILKVADEKGVENVSEAQGALEQVKNGEAQEDTHSLAYSRLGL